MSHTTTIYTCSLNALLDNLLYIFSNLKEKNQVNM